MKTKHNKKSISDIAEYCGVSAMTVSRALRGNASIKEATREKILQAAEQLGYSGPLKAGRPVNVNDDQKQTVEVILGSEDGCFAMFYSELLTALEQSLAAEGYDCIIRTCGSDYEQFFSLLDKLKASTASATMIVGYINPDRMKSILQAKPSAILLDNPGGSYLGFPYNSISFDNREAAKLAVSHLLDCGRQRVVLLKGSNEHYFSQEIEQGYRDALAQAGIRIDNELIVETDFTSETACQVIEDLLDQNIDFDSIFTNDEMASGVYRALYRRNLRVPDDIAVCGCDGLPISKQLTPMLTTVNLDYAELGVAAVEQAISLMKKPVKPKKVKLYPELVIQESTVCK